MKALSKTALLILLITLTCQAAHAQKIHYRYRVRYKLAPHITNPLSAMSKIGTGLEIRTGNLSYLPSYTKYIGVYPGYQYGMEFQYYFRTRKINQWYMYVKGVMGESGYDGAKLNMFGYRTDLKFDSAAYAGGGIGMGRRFNINLFFIAVSWGGVKYCALDISEADIKRMYTLFYYAGPGSYVDAHIQFGVQF